MPGGTWVSSLPYRYFSHRSGILMEIKSNVTLICGYGWLCFSILGFAI